MTLVIDLSHHNVIPESLQPAWDFGVRGLIHKVTEGSSFTDSKYQARYSMVYGTPMLWGVYHFIRPSSSIEDQAAYFLRQSLSVADSDTLFVCDYEDSGVSLSDVLRFMELIEKEIDTSPIIYSGHVLKEKMAAEPLYELTQYRLWLAQYSSTYTLPLGWDKYFLWQYTDKGSVPGIEPPTDMNKFDGNEAALRLQWCMPKVDLQSTEEETVMAYPKADDTYPASTAEAKTEKASSLPTNVEQREVVREREEKEWEEHLAELKREPPPSPEAKPLVTETTSAEQEAGKKALEAVKKASSAKVKSEEQSK